MPSQELFELQSNSYKNKILKESKYKVSIEAGSTDSWKKFISDKDACFGIDDFGKSAPYKDIYKFFGLESEIIVNKIKKMINRKT
tara:strand:- start:333 stop:587 length:255 start_codon:yes stop_codon:yes gene_type:complete